jgi:hypothetical protein
MCLHYKLQPDMMCKGIMAVYCENHTKDINTWCGQNMESSHVKAGGKYSYLCALNS